MSIRIKDAITDEYYWNIPFIICAVIIVVAILIGARLVFASG
jgi:hypothetical protein